MKKKLQVFVSSTYIDLIEERQAAVEAILDAGHIPAGMELFKAGNESQLKTIYRWIDESDVYMLILGGRYGSIEPKSGKSYTQLEYEYALSKNIPVFAVILNQSFLTDKINSLGLSNTIEQKAPDKYQIFKSMVMSKIIREVDDCKDIKLSVHSTLNEFLNEYDLIGWVHGNNENDTIQLLKDNNALIKENNSLNKQIQKLQEQLNAKSKEQFGKYTFEELLKILQNKYFTLPGKFFDQNTDAIINALNIFKTYYKNFCAGVPTSFFDSEEQEWLYLNICPYFLGFKLLGQETVAKNKQRYIINTLGASFYADLEANGYIEE